MTRPPKNAAGQRKELQKPQLTSALRGSKAKMAPLPAPHCSRFFGGQCSRFFPLAKAYSKRSGSPAREAVSSHLPADSGEGQSAPSSEGCHGNSEGGTLVAVSVLGGARYCPRCGSLLAQRQGRFGDFLGCSAFPKCRFSCNLDGSVFQRVSSNHELRVRLEMESEDTFRAWSSQSKEQQRQIGKLLSESGIALSAVSTAPRADWRTQAACARVSAVFALSEYDEILKVLNAHAGVRVFPIPPATLAFFRSLGKRDAVPFGTDYATPASLSVPAQPKQLLYDTTTVDSLALRSRSPLLHDALLPFQHAGIARALSWHGRVLFADEMGLGKTLQAIGTLSALDAWPALLIVPASLRLMWADCLERWLPETLVPSDVHVIAASTDAWPQQSALPKATVTSFRLATILLPSLRAFGFKALVVDESHALAATAGMHDAQHTEAVAELAARAPHLILISGTPSLCRPFQLFRQVDMLRAGLLGGSKWLFARAYCAGGMAIGASGVRDNELHLLLRHALMVRRRKSQLMAELPEKRTQWLQLQQPSAGAHANGSAAVRQGHSHCRAPCDADADAPFDGDAGADVGGGGRRATRAETDWHVNVVAHGDEHDKGDGRRVLSIRDGDTVGSHTGTSESELRFSTNTSDAMAPETGRWPPALTSASPSAEPVERAIRSIVHPRADERETDSAAHISGCAKLPAVCAWLRSRLRSDGRGHARSSSDRERASPSHMDGHASREADDAVEFFSSDRDSKLVLFAHHRRVLDGLEHCLRDARVGYIRIDGSTPPVHRVALIRRFRVETRTRVALISITAAGLGIDLSCAMNAVFAELPPDAHWLAQAEARLHRRGQKSAVNSIIMVAAAGAADSSAWQTATRYDARHKARINKSEQAVSRVTDGPNDFANRTLANAEACAALQDAVVEGDVNTAPRCQQLCLDVDKTASSECQDQSRTTDHRRSSGQRLYGELQINARASPLVCANDDSRAPLDGHRIGERRLIDSLRFEVSFNTGRVHVYRAAQSVPSPPFQSGRITRSMRSQSRQACTHLEGERASLLAAVKRIGSNGWLDHVSFEEAELPLLESESEDSQAPDTATYLSTRFSTCLPTINAGALAKTPLTSLLAARFLREWRALSAHQRRSLRGQMLPLPIQSEGRVPIHPGGHLTHTESGTTDVAPVSTCIAGGNSTDPLIPGTCARFNNHASTRSASTAKTGTTATAATAVAATMPITASSPASTASSLLSSAAAATVSETAHVTSAIHPHPLPSPAPPFSQLSLSHRRQRPRLEPEEGAPKHASFVAVNVTAGRNASIPFHACLHKSRFLCLKCYKPLEPQPAWRGGVAPTSVERYELVGELDSTRTVALNGLPAGANKDASEDAKTASKRGSRGGVTKGAKESAKADTIIDADAPAGQNAAGNNGTGALALGNATGASSIEFPDLSSVALISLTHESGSATQDSWNLGSGAVSNDPEDEVGGLGSIESVPFSPLHERSSVATNVRRRSTRTNGPDQPMARASDARLKRAQSSADPATRSADHNAVNNAATATSIAPSIATSTVSTSAAAATATTVATTSTADATAAASPPLACCSLPELFCSGACHAAFATRRSAAAARRLVAAHDAGVCEHCRIDCVALFHRLREASPGQPRLTMLHSLAPHFASEPALAQRLCAPGGLHEGNCWHTDHIVPVFAGGGECDGGNLQSLCVVCHSAKTKAEAAARVAAKRERKVRTASAAVWSQNYGTERAAVTAPTPRGRSEPVVSNSGARIKRSRAELRPHNRDSECYENYGSVGNNASVPSQLKGKRVRRTST